MATNNPKRFKHSKVVSERIYSKDEFKVIAEKPKTGDQPLEISDHSPIPDPTAENYYPHITLPFNTHPNRWYAAPLFGGLVKIFMLIPVAFWMFVLGLYSIILVAYNSCKVLFTGMYSKYCYLFFLGLMNLSARVMFFWSGLSDKYPGFSLRETSLVHIDMPDKPSRLWSVLVISGIVRIIFMLPFGIYQQLISRAANIGVFVSSLPVLFKGRYPESTWQLAKDSYRLNLATTCYMLGLRDGYPSFWISMKHQTVVVILIILALINIVFSNTSSNKNQTPSKIIPTTTAPLTPNNY